MEGLTISQEFRVVISLPNGGISVHDPVACNYETQAVVIAVRDMIASSSVDEIYDVIDTCHFEVFVYQYGTVRKSVEFYGNVPASTWYPFIEDTIREFGCHDFVLEPIDQDELFAMLDTEVT